MTFQNGDIYFLFYSPPPLFQYDFYAFPHFEMISRTGTAGAACTNIRRGKRKNMPLNYGMRAHNIRGVLAEVL